MSTGTPAAPHQTVQEQLLAIELHSMTNAALLMAAHILEQPAYGMDQLSEVRRVASRVMAARGPGSPV